MSNPVSRKRSRELSPHSDKIDSSSNKRLCKTNYFDAIDGAGDIYSHLACFLSDKDKSNFSQTSKDTRKYWPVFHKTLDFSYRTANPFKYARYIKPFINKDPKIPCLVKAVKYNIFLPEAADYLMNLASDFPNLETLELRFTEGPEVTKFELTPSLIEGIFRELSKLKKLTTLNFYEFFRIINKYPEIVQDSNRNDFLKAYTDGIATLKNSGSIINRIELSCKTPVSILTALGNDLKLEHCTLYGEGAEDDDLLNLSETNLPVTEFLMDFDDESEITDIGLQYLSKYNFDDFSISRNVRITTKGLSQALGKSDNLSTLNIRDCEGLHSDTDLVLAIKPTLTELKLSGDYKNLSGSFLVDSSVKLPLVKVLELHTFFDVEQYFKELPEMKNLESLEMPNVLISKGFEEEFVKKVSLSMPKLSSLYLNPKLIDNYELLENLISVELPQIQIE